MAGGFYNILGGEVTRWGAFAVPATQAGMSGVTGLTGLIGPWGALLAPVPNAGLFGVLGLSGELSIRGALSVPASTAGLFGVLGLCGVTIGRWGAIPAPVPPAPSGNGIGGGGALYWPPDEEEEDFLAAYEKAEAYRRWRADRRKGRRRTVHARRAMVKKRAEPIAPVVPSPAPSSRKLVFVGGVLVGVLAVLIVRSLLKPKPRRSRKKRRSKRVGRAR